MSPNENIVLFKNKRKVEQIYTQTLVNIKQLLSRFDALNIPSETKPSVQTKLPQINVPSFTGKFSEYKTFIGLFNSLIHNNSNLEKNQKLYYLRSFLLGEPLDLIKNLPLLDASYDESLDILDKRYNNEFLIKNELITILLDLPTITRSTPTALRSFLSSVKQQLAALKNLEINVDNFPVILAILLRKLDPL
ncbi:hypothetical protein ABMA28_003512 [Loxostege sticticalis]|uniref:Uncharacterized protein n=1 Tax=Loxostege sticticalis TaxID=481309 RepID=A0ABD0SWK1_LOXSC